MTTESNEFALFNSATVGGIVTWEPTVDTFSTDRMKFSSVKVSVQTRAEKGKIVQVKSTFPGSFGSKSGVSFAKDANVIATGEVNSWVFTPKDDSGPSRVLLSVKSSGLSKTGITTRHISVSENPIYVNSVIISGVPILSPLTGKKVDTFDKTSVFYFLNALVEEKENRNTIFPIVFSPESFSPDISFSNDTVYTFTGRFAGINLEEKIWMDVIETDSVTITGDLKKVSSLTLPPSSVM